MKSNHVAIVLLLVGELHFAPKARANCDGHLVVRRLQQLVRTRAELERDLMGALHSILPTVPLQIAPPDRGDQGFTQLQFRFLRGWPLGAPTLRLFALRNYHHVGYIDYTLFADKNRAHVDVNPAGDGWLAELIIRRSPRTSERTQLFLEYNRNGALKAVILEPKYHRMAVSYPHP